MDESMHMNVEAPSQHIYKDPKKAGKGNKCVEVGECAGDRRPQSTKEGKDSKIIPSYASGMLLAYGRHSAVG